MRISLSYPISALATAILLLGGCSSDDTAGSGSGNGSETAADSTTNDASGSNSSTASTTNTGDGDGDTGDGDGDTGDGDGDTGDGDGDTGDGDGDTGDGDGDTGDGDGDSGDGDGDTGDGDGDTGDGDGDTGGGNQECVVTECAGKVYQCGDCIDNDGDGFIDVADANCWGPCDNNEAGFKGNIPGQNQAPCTHMDCYFDQDSGGGNDKCAWSHKCDPSDPNPSACNYSPNGNIPGSNGLTCETAQTTQDPLCEEICGPLTPNGCDCFGCCDIAKDGTNYTVFLGTGGGTGTCSVDVVDDPTKCAPCMQVAACLNPCDADDCELCIGETELPDGCDEAKCDEGVVSCDPQNNNADCPVGASCISGCCQAFAQ